MPKIHLIEITETISGTEKIHSLNINGDAVDNDFDALWQAIYGWIHGDDNYDCDVITNGDIYGWLNSGALKVTNLEHFQNEEDCEAFLLQLVNGCECVYNTLSSEEYNDSIDHISIMLFFGYLINNGYADVTVWDMTNTYLASGGDLYGIALRAIYIN